jgi:membrane protease YdiL (CAAX protease family)
MENSEEEKLAPEAMGRHEIMSMSVLVEGLLVPAALLIGWWAGFDPLDKITPTWLDGALGLAGAAGLALLVIGGLAVPWKPVRSFRSLIEGQMFPLLAASTYPDRIGIALMAGFCEELLFRGAIQPGLALTPAGPWGALVITSVLFGALHGLSVAYFLLAFGISMLLGWFYLATDNLLGPMLLHGVYDLIILLALIPYEPVEESEDDSAPQWWQDE